MTQSICREPWCKPQPSALYGVGGLRWKQSWRPRHVSSCCVPTGEVYLLARYISYDFGATQWYIVLHEKTRGVMIGTYRPFKLSCVIRDRYPCSLGYQIIIGPLAQLVLEQPAHNRSVLSSSLRGSTIMARWSSWLRRCPFTAITWVRVPYVSPLCGCSSMVEP